MNPASANRPEAPDLELRPRQVHTITDRFAMANTYLVDDGRLFVVDPGPEQNVRLLQQYLQRFLLRSPAEIDLIVLTDMHAAHMAGVEVLKHLCGAHVAASAAVQRLLRMQTRVSHIADQLLPGALYRLDLLPLERLVDTWLEDVAGLPSHPDWRVIAVPGHTPGSLCLYNAFTRELLCGDILMTTEGNATLVRSQGYRPQMEETIQTLRSLPLYYLYPGRGRPMLSRNPLRNIRLE